MQNDDFNFPLPMHTQVLWLRISLDTALSETQVSAWRARLFAYLSARQLSAAASLQRIAVVPLRRSLSAFDRGMVIGWLLAQAEITQVWVTARPAHLAVGTRTSHPVTLTDGEAA